MKFPISKPLVVSIALAGIGGYYVARASTPHVASAAPLYYTGFLSQDGTPVESTGEPITIALLDAQTGGNTLCATTATVPVVAGNFSVALDASCHDKLIAAGTAFVQVSVNNTAVGTPQQVGTTPFAISAETAQSVPASAITNLDATTPWPGTIKSTQIVNPRPTIVGLTKVQYFGDGQPDNGTTSSGGYAALQSQCQADYGSTAFTCSMADAIGSLSRSQFGTNLPNMGTRGWVVGGAGANVDGTSTAPDCAGFTDKNAGSAVAFNYATVNTQVNPPTAVVVPELHDCSDAPFVLCCAFQ